MRVFSSEGKKIILAICGLCKLSTYGDSVTVAHRDIADFSTAT